MHKGKKAVVLISGGLDSATAAAVALKNGFNLFAITFHYGQKHSIEIESARRVSASLGVSSHIEIEIPAVIFSSSSLMAGSGLNIPRKRNLYKMNDIPSTYVPGRNIIFLSYAIAYAESINAGDIYIGINAVDYSGYPDCRPEFLKAFQDMANTGTKAGVMGNPFRINAPLLSLAKHEIIKLGVSLGVDYSLTHSCYAPDEDGFSCGECDSCLIRKKGFHDAGFNDPVKYRGCS